MIINGSLEKREYFALYQSFEQVIFHTLDIAIPMRYASITLREGWYLLLIWRFECPKGENWLLSDYFCESQNKHEIIFYNKLFRRQQQA